MNISKYAAAGGGYVYKDSCHYEDAESLLHCGFLGFCGCGSPEANLKLFYNALNHLQKLREKVWYGDNDDYTYEDWRKEGREMFGSQEMENLVWYVCDQKGLTEHGGSIPGWVDSLGYEFMEDVKELYDL